MTINHRRHPRSPGQAAYRAPYRAGPSPARARRHHFLRAASAGRGRCTPDPAAAQADDEQPGRDAAASGVCGDADGGHTVTGREHPGLCDARTAIAFHAAPRRTWIDPARVLRQRWAVIAIAAAAGYLLRALTG